MAEQVPRQNMISNFAGEMLYLIGLGLYDEKDISLRSLEIIRQCDKIFLESYTSILLVSKERLEALYERSVIAADREMVESQSDLILDSAKESNVALLVVGDPFGATTHADLVLRAFEMGIQVRAIHNASILTAIGDTGLFLYNFGPSISIPFFTETWKPSSFYHKIKENYDRGLHSLCLLDIKVKEQSEENLLRGRKIFEPPRFMSVKTAIEQLLYLEGEIQQKLFSKETLAVAVARLGSPAQKIVSGTFEALLKVDMGEPLHSLIIPGNLHEIEIEMLNHYKQ